MVARVERYDDFRQAVRGAHYIITQIRVGKMPARILDERIPMQHGLIGQETTGLGGLSCALRTVPVIDAIARSVRELAASDAFSKAGWYSDTALPLSEKTPVFGCKKSTHFHC